MYGCMRALLWHMLQFGFISGSRKHRTSPISPQNYNYRVNASLLPQHCVGGTSRLQRLSQPKGACAPCQSPNISQPWMRNNHLALDSQLDASRRISACLLPKSEVLSMLHLVFEI